MTDAVRGLRGAETIRNEIDRLRIEVSRSVEEFFTEQVVCLKKNTK